MNLVSVIMPCFNDGKYIKESIECILKQTYKNIELIIINDGSTDEDTINILNNITHPKIKIVNTNNIGPSGARNKGIELAQGRYILPLDADDIIDQSYIEKAVNLMDKDNNLGIVYCEAELFGEVQDKWNLPEYKIENMLLNNIIFITAMFRKEDWIKVKGFDTTFKHGLEDYDFWLSIIELDRGVIKIPEVLFKYRIKGNSRSKNFKKNIVNVKETYNKLYTKHYKLYSLYKDEYINSLRNRLIELELERESNINKIRQIPVLRLVINNKSIKNKLKKILKKDKL